MKDIFYEYMKDNQNTIFAQKQAEYPARLHFHRAFELAYIFEGQAKYIVDTETFLASSDHIVFCHCYYQHACSVAPPHTKYVIAIPERLTRDIAISFSHSTLPSLLPDKEFNKTLLPFFEKLVCEEATISSMLAKGYAQVIFGSLAEHYDSVSTIPKNKNISLIADILTYIDDHFQEPISLASISAHFGYNKTYFSRLFNRHIGMSLNNYINTIRLNQFEILYKNSKETNITDLIFACGFSSLATFYRVWNFRKNQR